MPSSKPFASVVPWRPPGHPAYAFDCDTDVIFNRKEPLAGHANGMAFHALDANDNVLLRQVYYSIGGGFVLTDTELADWKQNKDFPAGEKVNADMPFPFKTAREMLTMSKRSGLSIAAMKRANEETRMSRADLDRGLDRLWGAMDGCIDRGLKGEGRVARRASCQTAGRRSLREAFTGSAFKPVRSDDGQ